MLLREASFIAFSTQEFLNANELVTREKRIAFKKKTEIWVVYANKWLKLPLHYAHLPVYLDNWRDAKWTGEEKFQYEKKLRKHSNKRKKSSKWMQSKGTFPPLSPLSFFEDNTHRNIELLNFIRSEFTCVNFRNRIYLERKAELTLHLL